MTNVLVLGQHSMIAKSVAQKLRGRDGFDVTEMEAADFKRAQTYRRVLPRQNVIASFLGPMDVDLDFEALFDAISQVNPPVRQFLMLSHVDVDDGMKDTVHHVADVHEYLEEQRYAAKVVDESEIPYTILRPVTIDSSAAAIKPSIIEEGQKVPDGRVSYQNVAKIAYEVITKRQYLNQSIAIIDQK